MSWLKCNPSDLDKTDRAILVRRRGAGLRGAQNRRDRRCPELVQVADADLVKRPRQQQPNSVAERLDETDLQPVGA